MDHKEGTGNEVSRKMKPAPRSTQVCKLFAQRNSYASDTDSAAPYSNA